MRNNQTKRQLLKLCLMQFAFAAVLMGFAVAQNSQSKKSIESRVFDLPQGSNPTDVAVVGSRLVVAASKKKSLLVLDPSNGDLVREVPLPSEPFRLSYSQFGKKLYVTSLKSNSVYVLNSEDLSLMQTVTLPKNAQPSDIAVSQNAEIAFIGDRVAPQLFVVDLDDTTNIEQVAVSAPTLCVELDETGEKIYIGSKQSENNVDELTGKITPTPSMIDCVDMKSLKVLSSLQLIGNANVSLSLEKTGILYALYGGTLLKITFGAEGGVIKAKKELSFRGIDVLYDRNQNYVYISTSTEVSIVEPSTLSVIQSAPSVGSIFSNIASDKGKRHVYSPDFATDTISDFAFSK